MSKYSEELKVKIVEDIKKNNISFREAGRKYKIDYSQIIDWYQQYENNGIEGIITKNKKYDGKFKQNVVEYKRNNKMSLRETAIKFKIPSRSIIKTWEEIYDKEGPYALYIESRGRPKKMNLRNKKTEKKLTREEELEKENEELRMENEYLKKLKALVQERIKRENKKK